DVKQVPLADGCLVFGDRLRRRRQGEMQFLNAGVRRRRHGGVLGESTGSGTPLLYRPPPVEETGLHATRCGRCFRGAGRCIGRATSAERCSGAPRNGGHPAAATSAFSVAESLTTPSQTTANASRRRRAINRLTISVSPTPTVLSKTRCLM